MAGDSNTNTDRYQVVERRLQDAQGASASLADWIAVQRAPQPPVSWQSISFELWQITALRVNPETLRRWHTLGAGHPDQEGQEV